jgi:hypothetical protein
MVIPSHCMTGELYALSELFFCYLDSVFEPEMHQNYIEFFAHKILVLEFTQEMGPNVKLYKAPPCSYSTIISCAQWYPRDTERPNCSSLR